MKEFFLKLFNRDYRIFGALRSNRWPEARNFYIKKHPFCVICGKTDLKVLVVHHKKPFHLHPELELDPTNFVTLCESAGMNCHITFGHLGNFKSFNDKIDGDIIIWNQKISTRP